MNKLSKKSLMAHLHRANKMYANREPQPIKDLRNLYGGTHWFYYRLAAAGHLSKVDGKYVWSGGKLNKKSIRPILQGLRKHRRKINESYVARPLTINKEKLKEDFSKIDEQVLRNAVINPTINIILREIESEINQHRSNGESPIHLENVVRLTRDMEKIMD